MELAGRSDVEEEARPASVMHSAVLVMYLAWFAVRSVGVAQGILPPIQKRLSSRLGVPPPTTRARSPSVWALQPPATPYRRKKSCRAPRLMRIADTLQKVSKLA